MVATKFFFWKLQDILGLSKSFFQISRTLSLKNPGHFQDFPHTFQDFSRRYMKVYRLILLQIFFWYHQLKIAAVKDTWSYSYSCNFQTKKHDSCKSGFSEHDNFFIYVQTYCVLKNWMSSKKISRTFPGQVSLKGKIPGFSRTFQDSFGNPGVSRTFRDWWQPCVILPFRWEDFHRLWVWYHHRSEYFLRLFSGCGIIIEVNTFFVCFLDVVSS